MAHTILPPTDTTVPAIQIEHPRTRQLLHTWMVSAGPGVSSKIEMQLAWQSAELAALLVELGMVAVRFNLQRDDKSGAFQTLFTWAAVQDPHPMTAAAGPVEAYHAAVAAEVDRAQRLYPPFHSLHEAYGVLLEEMDELWKEVKVSQGRRSLTALQTEAVHVGAMVARLYTERLPDEATAREVLLYNVDALTRQLFEAQIAGLEQRLAAALAHIAQLEGN